VNVCVYVCVCVKLTL